MAGTATALISNPAAAASARTKSATASGNDTVTPHDQQSTQCPAVATSRKPTDDPRGTA